MGENPSLYTAQFSVSNPDGTTFVSVSVRAEHAETAVSAARSAATEALAVLADL